MTPAVELLTEAGVSHQLVSYEHDPTAESYGTEASEALGVEPGHVFKTLLATLDGTETVVAVVPVTGQLNLKLLAKAAGAKKAAMVNPDDAMRLTGYVVGGISPLGQRKRLRTFIDASAQELGTIYVSGGKRGLEIAVAPQDLMDLLDGTAAPLAAATS